MFSVLCKCEKVVLAAITSALSNSSLSFKVIVLGSISIAGKKLAKLLECSDFKSTINILE